ncbi:hypothetical protein CDAR_460281 [Caerostris darwini]|uniref:Uncharacterized protein n=1 Tax=Caerostris darwini TaxID=1538125 RepID=A0AAV4RCS2_9ARAC|nr:hypothetical protein CDAR_460281 [Caerostris darwini]
MLLPATTTPFPRCPDRKAERDLSKGAGPCVKWRVGSLMIRLNSDSLGLHRLLDLTPSHNQYCEADRFRYTPENLLHVTGVAISHRRRGCINFLCTSPDVPPRRSNHPTRCPSVFWAVPNSRAILTNNICILHAEGFLQKIHCIWFTP